MKTIKLSLLVVALLAAAGAQAQKAGDLILGVGMASIHPDSSLGVASSNNPYYAPLLPGATAHIQNSNTVSFSALYMYTDNIGAELSVGVPPKMKIDLNIPVAAVATPYPANYTNAANARALTPAIVGKYLFNNSNDQFRPYLGLGITHASFNKISVDTSQPLIAALASTSVSMSSSWAPIYNAGVIFNITDKWSINASVSYIPLKTDITMAGPGLGHGAGVTSAKLTMNPTDYVVRLGYKF